HPARRRARLPVPAEGPDAILNNLLHRPMTEDQSDLHTQISIIEIVHHPIRIQKYIDFYRIISVIH
ncbi:hypothetical protein, partial [uncultured Bifidobacterium sp.]|uniref:hypothetical protein n=1 Tax=uncultured Bifidobacterium sp. TaxID=165187 RepID=UPI0026135695